MKKLSIAFIMITVSLSVYAQSVSVGMGGNTGNAPLYGTAQVGIPIQYKFIKIDPFVNWMTFPLQRLQNYQQPYFKDVWNVGLVADFGYAYMKWNYNISARSYQQVKYPQYGKRYSEFNANLKDTNSLEVGFKKTFHTFIID